jgi:hypothetical protein
MVRFCWMVVAISWCGGAPAVAQDKERHVSPEGTWRLVSFKIDDAKDFTLAPAGETELKIISLSHVVSFRYDNKSKEVIRGVGGTCSWKGNAYQETIQYIMGSRAAAGPRGLLGKTYKSTWKIQDGKLHVSGEYDGQKVERVWQRVK